MFSPEIVASLVDQIKYQSQFKCNRTIGSRQRQQVITVKDAQALPTEIFNECHREIMAEPSDRLIQLHKLLRSDEAVCVDVVETDSFAAGQPGAAMTREPYFLTPPLVTPSLSRPLRLRPSYKLISSNCFYQQWVELAKGQMMHQRRGSRESPICSNRRHEIAQKGVFPPHHLERLRQSE